MNVIEKEEKYNSYYAITTNLDKETKVIVELSSNRYKMKDYYITLLIYRLQEAKMNQYGTHFTIENILETLNNMEVEDIEDMCYMSAYFIENTNFLRHKEIYAY